MYIDEKKIMENFIEVQLIEDFPVIKETLTRIGIPSGGNELFQSVHILHKRDKETKESKYYLVHFKHMFALDGGYCSISDLDKKRFFRIANYLKNEWGLLTYEGDFEEDEMCGKNQLLILKSGDVEKNGWILKQKYPIGRIKAKK